jgi:hypothetical protein
MAKLEQKLARIWRIPSLSVGLDNIDVHSLLSYNVNMRGLNVLSDSLLCGFPVIVSRLNWNAAIVS